MQMSDKNKLSYYFTTKSTSSTHKIYDRIHISTMNTDIINTEEKIVSKS